jgi:hypothetical protein
MALTATLTDIVKRIAKDRVLLALVLALITALVLLAVHRRDMFSSPSLSQKWGCAPGHVEFEKGCYDPSKKTYTEGKKLIRTT